MLHMQILYLIKPVPSGFLSRGQRFLPFHIFINYNVAECFSPLLEAQRLTAELCNVTRLRYLDHTFWIKPVGMEKPGQISREDFMFWSMTVHLPGKAWVLT